MAAKWFNSLDTNFLISDMPAVQSVQILSNVSSVSKEWTRKISFPANAALRTNYSRTSVLLPYYYTSIYLRQLMMLSADKNPLVSLVFKEFKWLLILKKLQMIGSLSLATIS